MFNIHLGGQEVTEDDYVVEMVMDTEILEEILEEEKAKEELANADPIKSHLAFNETAKPGVTAIKSVIFPLSFAF